ncbi:MAG: phosphatase PAP2 family protein [Bacteroidia bacterium]|nr:phosphatase PAP2 family protein [Bacteroidia bacterium]MCZ2140045.1 phosphatase PAP2 family protein [Bacteroidia bacterium]
MLEYIKYIDTQWFLAINNGLQNSVFDFVCPYLREPKFWIPLYLIAAWVAYKKFGNNALWLILAAGILVLVSDQFSANLIKKSVMRLRPCNDPILKSQVHLLVPCGGGFSFMSAHATNHFALAVYFGLLFKSTYKWILYFTLLWAACISISQVYVGVHYPMDIIFGGICGSLFGYFFYSFINKKLKI